MNGWYPPSRPRRVENGIKARKAQGSIGESWWSRRFIDVIESFALGSRLTRGRNYARAGQVISLNVASGEVTASVQGSRARPYAVRVGVTPYPRATWQRIETALADQARYSARLLAGEMPQDLEEVFTASGVSLFPTGIRDLAMRCSCPDSAVPCKHLAATLYLLAEAFDLDPFRILQWRGRSREELLSRLRTLRSAEAGEHQDSAQPAVVSEDTAGVGGTEDVLAGVRSAPLAECLDRFWSPSQPLPARPATLAADRDLLLRQLPPPSPRIGGSDLVKRLRTGYA
jgi:uncharacterized Zn finger protein